MTFRSESNADVKVIELRNKEAARAIADMLNEARHRLPYTGPSHWTQRFVDELSEATEHTYIGRVFEP